MDRLSKAIISIGIILALTTALYLYFFIPQYNFLSKEIQAVKMSSPVPINKVLIFGSGFGIFQLINYQQQTWLGYSNPSQLNVLYDGYYFPIYLNIKALGTYAPNLIGQKVYLDFITNNNNISVSAPYIIENESIKSIENHNFNEVIWNLTYDGNTSNAINSMLNYTTGKNTTSFLNGVILQDGTTLIMPEKPGIKNRVFMVASWTNIVYVNGIKYIIFVPTIIGAKYSSVPISENQYILWIDIGIASIFIILIAVKIKRKIKKSDKNERKH